MTLDRMFDPPDCAHLHIMSRLSGAPALTDLKVADYPPEPGEEADAIFFYRYSGAQVGERIVRVGVEAPTAETWAVAVLVPEGGDDALAGARLAAAREVLVGSGGRNDSGCVLACSREKSDRALDPDESGRRWTRRFDLYRLVVGP